jgi:hypothetical protein
MRPHDLDHDSRAGKPASTGAATDAQEGIVIDTSLRGAAALEALGDRLFAYPAEVAAVLDRDLRTIYAGLERDEIPYLRVGQRYQVSVSWLRRAAEGLAGSEQVPA